MKAFNLTQEEKKTQWHRCIEPPAWVLESMDRVRDVTVQRTTTYEAFSRMMIDQVVVAALYEQSRREEINESKSNSIPPAALRLVLEERLEKVVRLDGKDVTINGIADYAIFYDDPANDKYAIGLIAMEAKRRNCAGSALPQLIAYMGIVHSARKESGKENCVVWGFASDGFDYIFCRIDNESFFSQTKVIAFDEEDRDLVYGLLCSIVKAAALSSPTTSPEKNPEIRNKVLATLGSPERRHKFDYGVGEANYGLEPAPFRVLAPERGEAGEVAGGKEHGETIA
jgi:hypothetical protein